MSGWPALRAMRAVRECSELSARCRAVLLALISRADARGTCWPSYEKLASDTGLSRPTVRRALKELREANARLPVQVFIHKGKSRGRGRGRGPNVYHLQLGPARPPFRKETLAVPYQPDPDSDEIELVLHDDTPFLR